MVIKRIDNGAWRTSQPKCYCELTRTSWYTAKQFWHKRQCFIPIRQIWRHHSDFIQHDLPFFQIYVGHWDTRELEIVRRILYFLDESNCKAYYFHGRWFRARLNTDAFPKVCVFGVIEGASIDSRPHCRFDAFSTAHTKTFQNDRIAHATNAKGFDIFGHRFHFDPFSTIFDQDGGRGGGDLHWLIRYVGAFVVGGTPKRIEMY